MRLRGWYGRYLVTNLLVLTCGVPCQAQRNWEAGVRTHYGYLWPHRPSSWILVEGHAPAVEVFTERQVSGKQAWHTYYAMPFYGIGVLYGTMANPERIGTCVRIFPYTHLPVRNWKHGQLGFRLGWGVGYVAKPFNRRDNLKQIAIGSRINTAIQFMPEVRITLGGWRIHAGVGLDHWSNGSFKLPNLGLNYLSANLAASYGLGKPRAAQRTNATAIDTSRHREWSVVGAFGVNEAARPLSGQFAAFSVVAQHQWRITPKSLLMAGADLFNKGSLMTIRPELRGRERLELTQVAAHGGYALLFGQGELFFHMGAYVYTPAPDEAMVFHRLGVRYRTGRHLIWNVALKSHFAVADHWEFGVGYRWN